MPTEPETLNAPAGLRHRLPLGPERNDDGTSLLEDDHTGHETPAGTHSIPDASPTGIPHTTEPIPPEVNAAEEKLCRICLAGEEEEPELGRLFKPCRCKGTMKYVHVKCLDQWRKMSPSRQAYYGCDQCGYKYTLARTKAIGLANSTALLGVTTAFVFTCVVFVASFLVLFFAPELDPSVAPSTYSHMDRQASSRLHDFSDYTGLIYSPAAAASNLIHASVETVNDLVFSGTLDTSADSEFGPIEKFIWQLTSSSREMARERRRRILAKAMLDVDLKQQQRKRHPDKKARLEEPLDGDSPPGPPVFKRVSEPSPTFSPGLIYRLIQRFIVGLSFIGILSFLNLLVSLSFYAPAQIMRWLGAGRGRDRTNGMRFGSALILVFVVVGVVRAVMQVYRLNRAVAHSILVRAESAILEVKEAPDDDNIAVQEPLRKRAANLMAASWRRMRNRIGDPFEPFGYKAFRYCWNFNMWLWLKLIQFFVPNFDLPQWLWL